MESVQLIVAGPDREYLHRLTLYVRREGLEGKWRIKTFSDLETFRTWLASRPGYDLMAVDEQWLEEGNWVPPKKAVLIGSTSGEQIRRKDRGSWNVVSKYQPAPLLLSDLEKYGSSQLDRPEIRSAASRGAKIIGVYSAAGGCGKTTVAMQLLKQMVRRNERVFFLNLEMVPSAGVFWPVSEEDEFAQLLYYLKTGSDSLASKLETFIRFHPDFRCDYVPPFLHLHNRLELGGDEVGRLLELVQKHRAYDSILIDLDSALHESTSAALQACDRIVWLLTDDVQCMSKTSRAFHGLVRRHGEQEERLRQKSLFILNKFTGDKLHDRTCDQWEVSAALPYIPQWKAVSSPRDLDGAPIFGQKLDELYAQWMTGRKGESGHGRDDGPVPSHAGMGAPVFE